MYATEVITKEVNISPIGTQSGANYHWPKVTHGWGNFGQYEFGVTLAGQSYPKSSYKMILRQVNIQIIVPNES